MKYKLLLALFALSVVCPASFSAVGTTIEAIKGPEIIKLNMPIKKLIAEPKEGADSTFDVPIEMKLIGRTSDRKWYKARISYDFLGHYEYEGWLKVE